MRDEWNRAAYFSYHLAVIATMTWLNYKIVGASAATAVLAVSMIGGNMIHKYQSKKKAKVESSADSGPAP